MKYEHTPRPEVEQHYHIRDLIEAQEKRSADRTHNQNIEKQRDSFAKEVAGFKSIEVLDFWCDTCRIDFIARARKQIDGWAEIAYYKIKHRCGEWSLRRITDRVMDNYFFRSRRVASDRGAMFKDALQPFETGYNMLYKKN